MKTFSAISHVIKSLFFVPPLFVLALLGITFCFIGLERAETKCEEWFDSILEGWK